jgi:UV DNA damage endonuclease
MKIGYAGLNYSVDCAPSSTFRLKSYSSKKLKEKTSSNLECLERILNYNIKNNILFFRVGSGLVPFASHPVCNVNWQQIFLEKFKNIGNLIKENNLRITMHPDHFTILNSPKKKVLNNSIQELEYHADILDLMGLNNTAKINIHVGGVYNNKEKSIKRFIKNYKKLSLKIKKRLVIENDEKSYNATDCLKVSKETNIPITLDYFHYKLHNINSDFDQVMDNIIKTWQTEDGLPVFHYSSQDQEKRRGAHAKTLNKKDFKIFLQKIRNINCDLVLEIKDKEKSVLKALTMI